MADRLIFLKAWLASPRRVAALGPSSRSFAALAARGVDPADGPVIELGAGTGPVTTALLDRGVAERDLVLVESDPSLADVLRRRFPSAVTISADAGGLGGMTLFGGRLAGTAISGLPVLTMNRRTVAAILAATFDHLRPGASLYQYTYSMRCPIPRTVLDPLGLVAQHAGITFGNVPPGWVYRIRRRTADLPAAQIAAE